MGFSPEMRRIALVGLTIITVAVFAVGLLGLVHEPTRSARNHLWSKASGPYTVDERVEQFSDRVAERLRPAFTRAGLPYPPGEIAYLAFKDSRVLEVYARQSASHPWRHVKAYPVRGASGRPGPKLAEGDLQVPEGVYRAEFLNANSRFHLSIRLNYPNAFDREMARNDGRTALGGDIMIHGSSSSIGCLAMGDEAAEDLFVLAALVTKEKTHILVSPTDFRVRGREAGVDEPRWVHRLYETLRSELARFHRDADVTAGADATLRTPRDPRSLL